MKTFLARLSCSLFFVASALAQQRAVNVSAVPSNAGAVPLVVTGLAGQTANLQNWRSSDGTVLASVNSSGIVQGSVRLNTFGENQVVYSDSTGTLQTLGAITYNPATTTLTLATNLLDVQGYLNSQDMASFGNGQRLTKSLLTISAVGESRIRSSAGFIQFSNNGGGWVQATVGTGTTNTLALWTSANQVGAFTALTNGQLAIGSTGAAPVAAAITAGTAIGVTNGAGTITIANTGVTSAIAGTGISVSGATGAVTITNTAPNQTHGTTTCVTSVNFGAMTTTTATCLTP